MYEATVLLILEGAQEGSVYEEIQEEEEEQAEEVEPVPPPVSLKTNYLRSH